MHLFRKYLDNRGSALFMVISTMTAIMISCMAMYFSVISSRSSQYAVFNQQQSKEAAVSISDAVLAGMMDGKNTELQPLFKKVVELKPGEKLTTDGNGFKAFDLSGTGLEDDPNLGSYMVEITCLAEGTYDIVVKSSVNGVNDIYHNIIDVEAGEGGTVRPSTAQIFAATGYVPNDVFMDGGFYYADMFYDNEMVVIDAYGDSSVVLYGNLSAGGSVTVAGQLQLRNTSPVTHAIRGNMELQQNNGLTFTGCSGNTVYVGGDLILNRPTGPSNCDIYVLGDLYCFGNLGPNNCNIYVDGDVYMVNNNANQVYTNKKVKLINNGGKYTSFTETGDTATSKGTWDAAAAAGKCLTVEEMIADLDTRTQSNQYYKWEIDEKDVPEVNMKTGVKKKIIFNTGWQDRRTSVELKYGRDGKGCIIEDVICNDPNGYGDVTLVVDTGEDENNVYTLRLMANRDDDNDGKKETFSWLPAEHGLSVTAHVLVKGRGSLVVDVPEGVIYQDQGGTTFMHYGWFLLAGGQESTTVVDGEERVSYSNFTSDTGKYLPFIHQDCEKDDGCTYKTEEDKDNVCPTHNIPMTILKCGVHGEVKEFCSKCTPMEGSDYHGACRYRVGRKEIDDYLASHVDIKAKMTGTDGELIYPTTNVYLISCEESAEFRFSSKKYTNANVGNNIFIGYVYAPYMTYKASVDQEHSMGGHIRIIGGMTVSDYAIDETNATIACWPEKMPNELMSGDSLKNPIDGFANKSWKISLSRH